MNFMIDLEYRKQHNFTSDYTSGIYDSRPKTWACIY